MNKIIINKRKVKIENFRNIFTPSNELYAENKTNKKQNGNELILSHNNKTGGVVLLIGPNNSGKSNILDALEFSTINSEEKIIPQQTYYNRQYRSTQSEKSTKIKFSSPDWFHTEEEKKQNPTIVSIDSFENDLFSIEEMSKSEIFQDIYWDKIITNEYYEQSWSKEKIEILDILTKEKKLNKCLSTIIIIYMSISMESYNEDRWIKDFWSNDGNIIQSLTKWLKKISTIEHKRYYLNNDSWLLSIIERLEEPAVIRYDEKNDEIKNDDLDLDFLKLNKFGENFFSIIDGGLELKNKYIGVYNNRDLPENMKIQNYESIINNVNKKLMSVSKKFNELYFSSSESYVFELKRKETYTSYLLCLSVQDEKDGNVPINLDSQSWGFKWFFNFFFNVFSNRELHAGTIVLIEEPAVNLHVEGQTKWIEFVREFAVKNKITFVITTHSPFLIDSNRLDEIRIVYKDGKYCKINNYFSVNVVEDVSGTDSLESIKKSMTFQNMASILYKDKGTQFYLVEGIIDYAILTYFKRINEKYNNLHFLPINGINAKNTNEEKRKSLISEITKIYGSNAKIIVDNDKAGIEFEKSTKKYKTDIIVRNLSEIGKTDIESFFLKDDLKIIQFGKSKSASKPLGLLSSSEKPSDIFSKETINNFIKFLDLLLND